MHKAVNTFVLSLAIGFTIMFSAPFIPVGLIPLIPLVIWYGIWWWAEHKEIKAHTKDMDAELRRLLDSK